MLSPGSAGPGRPAQQCRPPRGGLAAARRRRSFPRRERSLPAPGVDPLLEEDAVRHPLRRRPPHGRLAAASRPPRPPATSRHRLTAFSHVAASRLAASAASRPPQRPVLLQDGHRPGSARARLPRPSPLAFDEAHGHHPGGRVTLAHCGEALAPARGGRGREARRCLPPGPRSPARLVSLPARQWEAWCAGGPGCRAPTGALLPAVSGRDSPKGREAFAVSERALAEYLLLTVPEHVITSVQLALSDLRGEAPPAGVPAPTAVRPRGKSRLHRGSAANINGWRGSALLFHGSLPRCPSLVTAATVEHWLPLQSWRLGNAH